MKITQLIWGETINAYIIEVEINTSQSYTFIHDEGSSWILDPNSSSPQLPKVELSLNHDHRRKEEGLFTNGKHLFISLSRYNESNMDPLRSPLA